MSWNKFKVKEILTKCIFYASFGLIGAGAVVNAAGVSDKQNARQTVLDAGYTQAVYLGKADVFACSGFQRAGAYIYRDMFAAVNNRKQEEVVVVCRSPLTFKGEIKVLSDRTLN